MARIFPAYWLALTVVLLLGAEVRHQTPGDLLRLFSLTQAYTLKGLLYDPIPPAWTICVELSFYLFLPLWALAAGRFAARARKPLFCELALLVPLAVSAFAWRAAVVSHPALPTGFQHLLGVIPFSDKLLFSSLDLFAAGMALAILSAYGRLGSIGLNASRAWGFALFGFLALSWMMAPDGPLGSHWRVQEVIGGGLRVPIAVLMVLPAVLAQHGSGSRVSRLLGSRALTGVGLVSYGVYLWHSPVLAWVYSWTGHLAAIAIYTWVVLAGASLALTMMISAVSWRFLERPLLRAAHALTRVQGFGRSPGWRGGGG